MSALLQLTIVDALRCFSGPVSMAELRVKLSETLTINSVAPVAAAVQALRYQGKVAWDRLELSDSMKSAGAPPVVEEGGAAAAKVTSPPSGPDDEDHEDYPGGVNDVAGERSLPAIEPERVLGTSGGGFVPPKLLHKAGIHAAATRAAGRPVPAPAHEPEIARLVREEVTDGAARRARARSTGTVRQPLELRKFGVRDMSLGEAVSSLLAEEPHDLVVAINRKHPELWRRILLLGRAMKLRPAEALYAVIERGLGELEPTETETAE